MSSLAIMFGSAILEHFIEKQQKHKRKLLSYRFADIRLRFYFAVATFVAVAICDLIQDPYGALFICPILAIIAYNYYQYIGVYIEVDRQWIRIDDDSNTPVELPVWLVNPPA